MADYSRLGFKCGIEIHQQLEGKKLFCSCPTLNSDEEPGIKIERRLRAVAGETGEIDVAAKHEMEKGKKIIYLADSRDVCLVELDEDPPHELNREALNIALQAALLLNARIIDEMQVMRKTVVDGSNTSGFQRTALIAADGWIETSLGKVGIPTICIEEEAAQKIEETKDSITYKLDRLGIPLIEIGTSADIKSPEHAKEVAEHLGMVLRSTGSCKRGIGTIRQDVNVSIKGHPRVEIKGFQDIKSIVKTIDYEIQRQLKENKGEPHVRKVNPDFTTSFLRPMPGSARMYPETDIAPIKISKEMLKSIKLPKLIANELEEIEEKYGVEKEKVKALMKSGRLLLFEEISGENGNLKAAYICEALLSFAPEILKKHKESDISKIKDEDFKIVFSELNKGRIMKESVFDILSDIALGKGISLEKYEAKEINLESEIMEIVKSKPGLSFGAYMGIIMGKHKGKIDGKKAMEVLKKIVG